MEGLFILGGEQKTMIILSEQEKNFAEHLKIYHLGKENSVTSRNLKHIAKGVEIREMSNRLRQAGVPICSGRYGYYFASDSRELKETLNFLSGHIQQVQRAHDGLLDTFYEMRTTEILDERERE
jgi:hypothetical protein